MNNTKKMTMSEKICANCSYWNPQAQQCVRTNTPMRETDYCSYHSTNPIVCQTCGRYIIGKSFYTQTQGSYIEICGNCAPALSTCAGCRNAQRCEFETNSDPIPKVVMQQIRQGNAVIQTQVRNPERIKKFCVVCPCWDKNDSACNRDFNTCGSHHCILDP